MSYLSPGAEAVGTTHFSGEPLGYDAIAAMPTGQFNSAVNISGGQYSSGIGLGAGQYSSAVGMPPTGQYNSAVGLPSTAGQYSSAVGMSGGYSNSVGIDARGGTAGRYNSAVGMSGQYSSPETFQSNYPDAGQYSSAVGMPPTAGQYGSTQGQYSDVGMSGFQYNSPLAPSGRFSSAVGRPIGESSAAHSSQPCPTNAGRPIDDFRSQQGPPTGQFCSGTARAADYGGGLGQTNGGQFCSGVARAPGDFSSVATAKAPYDSMPGRQFQSAAACPTAPYRPSPSGFIGAPRKTSPEFVSMTPSLGGESYTGRHGGLTGAAPVKSYGSGIQTGALAGGGGSYVPPPAENNSRTPSRVPSVITETGAFASEQGGQPPVWGSERGAGTPGGGSVTGGSVILDDINIANLRAAGGQSGGQRLLEAREAVVEAPRVLGNESSFTAQLPPGARVIEPSRYIRSDSPTPAKSTYGTGIGGMEPGRILSSSSTPAPPARPSPLYGTGLGGVNGRSTTPLSTPMYDTTPLYGTGAAGVSSVARSISAPIASPTCSAKPLYGTTLGGRDSSSILGGTLPLNGMGPSPLAASSSYSPQLQPTVLAGTGLSGLERSLATGANTASLSYQPARASSPITPRIGAFGGDLSTSRLGAIGGGLATPRLGGIGGGLGSPVGGLGGGLSTSRLGEIGGGLATPRLGGIGGGLSGSRLGDIGGGLATPRLGGIGGGLASSMLGGLGGIGGGLSGSRLGDIGGGIGGIGGGLASSRLGDMGGGLSTPRLIGGGLGGLDSPRLGGIGDGLGTPRLGAQGGLIAPLDAEFGSGLPPSPFSPRITPSSSSYTPALSRSQPVLGIASALGGSSVTVPSVSRTSYEEETYFSLDRILNNHRSQPLQMYPQPMPYDDEVAPTPMAACSTPRTCVAPPIVAPPVFATPPMSRAASQPVVPVTPPLTPLPAPPGSNRQLLVQPVSQFTEIVERPVGMQGSYVPLPTVATPCGPGPVPPMGGSLRLPPGRPFGSSVAVPPRSATPGPMPQFGAGNATAPPFAFGIPPPPIGSAPPPPIGFGTPGRAGSATPPGFGGAMPRPVGLDGPMPPPMAFGPMPPPMAGGGPMPPPMGPPGPMPPPMAGGGPPGPMPAMGGFPFGNGAAMPPFEDGGPVEDVAQYRHV